MWHFGMTYQQGVIGTYFFLSERGNAMTVISKRYIDMSETFVANNFIMSYYPSFLQVRITVNTAIVLMPVIR